MSANGKLSPAELAPIGGGFYLARPAAAAFVAMNAEARAKYGSIVVLSAYRTYGQQLYFWNLYVSGRGNLAARPGTSNHGLGVAIDVNRRSRWIIDQIGAKYGFAKRWSDAPSEWWHIRWDARHMTVDLTPTLRQGSGGSRVAALQRRLRVVGFASVPGPGKKGYGFYGVATVEAVRRFQRAHHLHVDGQVGPVTAAALRAV